MAEDDTDMTREMEERTRTESVEILPEGIGEMPAVEAAPLLERASSRIHTLGRGGEFWDGLRQNFEGAAAWIKAEKAGLVKKSLSVIVGTSFLATTLSACTNGPGTVYVPSETAPGVTEVAPTTTDVPPTETASPTVTETASPTATVTEAPTNTPAPTETNQEKLDALLHETPPGMEIQEVYTVQKGDTLEAIAEKYGLTPAEIMFANPDRVKWYTLSSAMEGAKINIPTGISAEAFNNFLTQRYEQIYQLVPGLDGHEKVSDPTLRFVLFKNETTGEIDRAFDLETGEIMGYAVSKEGTVILTSPGILKSTDGKKMIPLYGPGDIDKAIALWKKHMDGKGQFLVGPDTQIIIEYRFGSDKESDPLKRPMDTLVYTGGGRGAWYSWSTDGSFLITAFNDYFQATETPPYTYYASSGVVVPLILSIPEFGGPNKPDAWDWEFKYTSPDSPGADIKIAAQGKFKLQLGDKPCPIGFEK